MQKILRIIIILITSFSLVFNSGCSFLATTAAFHPGAFLAGTVGAIVIGSMVSEGLEKAEKEKKRKFAEKTKQEWKEKTRRAEIRREEAKRRLEQARLKLEEAMRKEISERQEAKRLKQTRLREEDRRRKEAKRQEQARLIHLREEKAIKKEVVVFLADIEDRLKRAYWDRKALPELLEKASYLDRKFLPSEIRQRLNLAAGLYAYLTGDKQQAKANFRKAKELGVRKPQVIVPEVWTPGSIEVFNAS